MTECEMYLVTIDGGASGMARHAMLCSNCGFTTLETAASFCPNCGAHVASVCDDGDEWDAVRAIRAQGFDEGYQQAMDEMESR